MLLFLYRAPKDEATFDKRDVSCGPVFNHLVKNRNETSMWQRGQPKTLILRRLHLAHRLCEPCKMHLDESCTTA